MISYFAVRRGLAYEGDGNFFRAIHPTPVLTCARWPGCAPTPVMPGCPSPLFREDSFDPVTRIRRGRFYVLTNPSSLILSEDRVHNYPYGPHIGAGAGWQADGYYRPVATGDFPDAQRIESMELVLGEAPATTPWRAVAAERISSGELLFTLRARSSLGALPTLADVLLTRDGSSVSTVPIQEALDQLVDASHRQQVTPIVDVARETVKVILTAWLGVSARGKDLGKVIEGIPDDKSLMRWAASIVNRLHPRGKSAERETRTAQGVMLRPVVDEDAETSVHLVGLVLREVGWVRF